MKPTSRKERNKLTIALLSPIVTVIFIIGWGFYQIGQLRQKKQNNDKKRTTLVDNNRAMRSRKNKNDASFCRIRDIYY